MGIKYVNVNGSGKTDIIPNKVSATSGSISDSTDILTTPDGIQYIKASALENYIENKINARFTAKEGGVYNAVNVALTDYQLSVALGNTQSSNTAKGKWFSINLDKGSYFGTIDGSMYDRCFFDVTLIDSAGISRFTVMFRDLTEGVIISHNNQSEMPKLEALINNNTLYLHPLTKWGCNWYIQVYGSRQIKKVTVNAYDETFYLEGQKPTSLTGTIITSL